MTEFGENLSWTFVMGGMEREIESDAAHREDRNPTSRVACVPRAICRNTAQRSCKFRERECDADPCRS